MKQKTNLTNGQIVYSPVEIDYLYRIETFEAEATRVLRADKAKIKSSEGELQRFRFKQWLGSSLIRLGEELATR